MGAAIRGPEGLTELGNEPLTIGRSRNNRLVYTNSQISSRHAEIQLMPDGRYQVVDVGSTNGTAVNGVKLNAGVPQPLNAGDVILLGGSGGIELRFELTATNAPWAANQPQMPPAPGPVPFGGQDPFGTPAGASFGGISQPA
ncbi:MAG TPA: FHA domain-containing protein, partial [Candidatus Angelobacter sp.]|nr:FHA domain-containing protein [Candidatus Angelobacter sp.]